MATSKNSSSPADVGRPTPGVGSGAGADLSGGMPPPKAAQKSKVKTKPAEGKSAEGRPAEGLSTAKPLPKAKSKGQAAGAAPGAGQSQDASSSAAGEPRQPSPSSGGDGAGQATGTGASSARSAAPTGERLSDEERQRRISEAAYRKAQERGFSDDRQLDDWLEAEREIDRGMGGTGS